MSKDKRETESDRRADDRRDKSESKERRTSQVDLESDRRSDSRRSGPRREGSRRND